MSDLLKRLSDLSPEKRALLARRLKKKEPAEPSDRPAARVKAAAAVAPRQKERAATETVGPERRDRSQLDFSLFFFTGDGSSDSLEKYRLLLASARLADRLGFKAIWTPERHFHPFGGLYPNPSVISAALAVATNRLELRAGSVVLPLHHPARVAEEWSVVENLSQGRIGLAFASGWHPDDFVFSPSVYAERRERTWKAIEDFEKLWSGQSLEYEQGTGKTRQVRVYPKPIRERIPIWVTTGGSPDTFEKAGELGANLLTNLLGQDVANVERNVGLYRDARARHGHDPEEGRVTLMMHAFVGGDEDAVRERVRGPFRAYLKTFTGLLDNLAQSMGAKAGKETLGEADMEALLDFAFNRYYDTAALFGTPSSCLGLIDQVRRIGVDEVACLVDFGIEEDLVLESLEHLDLLRRMANAPTEDGDGDAPPSRDLTVITDISQVTASWLTGVLRRGGLERAEVESLREFSPIPTTTSVIHRLQARYSADAEPAAPTQLLLKLSKEGLPSKFGSKEVRFYKTMAARMDEAPTVRCFDAAQGADGRSHVLIEDLSKTHFQTEWPLPPSAAYCEMIVEALAGLHAFWWERSGLDELRRSAAAEDDRAAELRDLERASAAFLDFLGDRLSPARRRLYGDAVGSISAAMERHRKDRLASLSAVTLVHGDAHFWSFMCPIDPEADPVRIIDWQSWDVDVGTNDLAQMIALYMSSEERSVLEKTLLERYHTCLRDRGVGNYSWDDCWLDYRVSAVRNLLLPLWQWSNGLPANIWWPLLERALESFDSLDCAELVRG